MMKSRSRYTLLLMTSLLIVACGPSHFLAEPDGFKRYEDADAIRMITADGVMLKVREVENYPEGTLDFWTDAFTRHFEAQGYVAHAEHCFSTTAGLPGCTLDFLLPHGADDWVFSETLFVIEDTIVLVEVAGPFARYQPVAENLKRALVTFEPDL